MARSRRADRPAVNGRGYGATPAEAGWRTPRVRTSPSSVHGAPLGSPGASARGGPFIHLNLKFAPNQAALDWAQEMLAAHPQRPAILSTHAYLTDEAGCGRAEEGEIIREGLVRNNDQIFMVISGHYHESDSPTASGEFNEDGECHQISRNDASREVFELLANYQDYPNGGDGWLQLIEFDVVNDQITVRTYSPFLDAFQTDANSQFSFDVDFASRLKQ